MASDPHQPHDDPHVETDDSPVEDDHRSERPDESLWKRGVSSPRTASWVAGLEDRWSAFRRERKIGKGTLRSTHIAAYYGYVADGCAHVRVRVIEEPVIPDQTHIVADPDVIRSNVRRFLALPFPGVKVSSQLNSDVSLVTDHSSTQSSTADARDRAVTDRHGFAVMKIPVGQAEPGWMDYHVSTQPVDPDEVGAHARSQVLVPDQQAPVWVISDLDDTVIQTGLAEGLTALKNTFLGQARTRKPVEGMSVLYRAIEAGLPGPGRSPFFYVSTGPWNLYDMLVEFLRVRGYPLGPLFLTDWGPQERFLRRSGTEHKRHAIQRLFHHFPEQRFLLIGDSGQLDAQTYTTLAVEYPESVTGIIIMDIGHEDRRDFVTEQEQRAIAANIPFCFADDAIHAGRVLAQWGVVPASVAETIATTLEARRANTEKGN